MASQFETDFSSTLGRLDVLANKIVQNQKDQQRMSQVLGTYLSTINKAVDNLDEIDNRLRQFISDSTNSIQGGINDVKEKERLLETKDVEIQRLLTKSNNLEINQLELESAVFAKNARNEEITQRFADLQTNFEAKKAEDQAALVALTTEKQELETQLQMVLTSAETEINTNQLKIRELTTQMEANTAASNEERQTLENELRLTQDRADVNSSRKQELIRELSTRMEENTAATDAEKRVLQEQLQSAINLAETVRTTKQTEIAELNSQIEANNSDIFEKSIEIDSLNEKIEFVETESSKTIGQKDAEIALTRARSQELQEMSAEELRTKMAECEARITALQAEKTQLLLEKEQLTADKVRLEELIRSATTTLESIILLLTTFEGASNAENESSTAVSLQITQKLAEQTSKLENILLQLNESGLISTDFVAPIIEDTSNPMRVPAAADMSVPVNEEEEVQRPLSAIKQANKGIGTFKPNIMYGPKKPKQTAEQLAVKEAGPAVQGKRVGKQTLPGTTTNRGGTRRRPRRRSSTKRRRRSTKRRNHKRKSTRKKRKGRKLSGGYTYSARTTPV